MTGSDRPLWFAVAAGPVAWTLDELAAIAITYDHCARLAGTPIGAGGVTAVLLLLALVAAAVALFGGFTAWRYTRSARSDDGTGDTVDDRRRFMARAAMVISVLTAFGILLRFATVLFVSPSAC